MVGTEQELADKTFSFRMKDATSKKHRVAFGNATNTILRNFLEDKCDHAGVVFAEVDEAYKTQACSWCGALSGPHGREGLAVSVM